MHDLTSGYKAFSRRALEAIDLSSIHSNGYSFQIEMTYRAILKGMRVKEVPIVFVDRAVGKSKMSRKIFIEADRRRLEAPLRRDARDDRQLFVAAMTTCG